MASGPIPFIDGHNDVLLALYLAGDGAGPFLAGRSEGHLDLARARKGGFAAGFFAVFVLPETEEERAATRLPDRKPPYAQPLAPAVPTAYAARDAGGGLTEAGRRLVAECNSLGILIDLAHLNERGFWDVAGLSAAPLVASHSNAHALSPNSRNLTDPQLDEIGRSGGIVGIAFHAGMLTEAGGVDPGAPLARVIDHVDYVADRIGIVHVGFGSDFDGATVPTELGDAMGLPRVVEALRDRGHSEEDIAKLAHGNWLRVLNETWKA